MTTYVNVRHNATMATISALNEGLDPSVLVKTFEDQIKKTLDRFSRATNFKLDIKRNNPTLQMKMDFTEECLLVLKDAMHNDLDHVSSYLETITPGHALTDLELKDLNVKILNEASNQLSWFKRGRVRALKDKLEKVWEV